MTPLESGVPSSAPPRLIVRVSVMGAPEREYRFHAPFRIGRVEPCDVCVVDDHVSRSHAEVLYEESHWLVRDLNSSNGIFVGDKRVASAIVTDGLNIRLGVLGPQISFHVGAALAQPSGSPRESSSKAAPQNQSVGRDANVDRYFKKPAGNETFGEHTMLVRRAFAQVQTKQRSKYGAVIALLLILAAVGAAIGYREHRNASEQRQTAENLFYAMKSLDVDIARLQELVIDSNSQKGRDEVRTFEQRRREMQSNYDRFVLNLHLYDRAMTPQDRLILLVARIFGECELATPPQFVTEVNNYIKKWQSSGRLARAVKLANEKGYSQKIAGEFLAQDLPPQFYYLGLQESDFDPYITGPLTYKGFAKGMWQFIPETGLKYGLHIGPLVDLPRPDPGDDRNRWELETKAAAHYIKDLYGTDAQASGLLVAACYNWGEGRVLPLVRSMPLNPHDRNFWRLLTRYREKIPQETYDYVFYIVSAAVIGENPRLFGFDFDNPLAHLDHSTPARVP